MQMKFINEINEPIVVAVARDRYLSPIHPFADGVHLPSVPAPRYGQDITYGCRASAPQRQSVGDTVDVLKPKMEKLLGIFARADTTGVARTLFSEFLRENRKGVEYFEDPRLTGLVSSHANMEYFCSAVQCSAVQRCPLPIPPIKPLAGFVFIRHSRVLIGTSGTCRCRWTWGYLHSMPAANFSQPRTMATASV